MTGKDILKNKSFIEGYDEIENVAVKKLDEVFGDDLNEITQEESDRYETIADYKYQAQLHLQTADLYFERLKEL